MAAFDCDRWAVLERATAGGVAAIVVPGIAATGWAGLLQICAQDSRLYPALGIHPLVIPQHEASDFKHLEKLITQARPIAIGEIGLDASVGDVARQQPGLERQLALACAADLPVLLHVRKAHEPMLACLSRLPRINGIVHAFNGSLEQAKRYLDLGFKLGFGGMLTYPRSTRLRRLAAALPDTSLVLETDAPDMTGAAHCRQRNSPEYLPEVLTTLAQIRTLAPDTLAAITTANAQSVLNLDVPLH